MAHFGKLQLGLLTWLAGVALNLVGYALSRAFDLPLTLDGVGTVLLALSMVASCSLELLSCSAFSSAG